MKSYLVFFDDVTAYHGVVVKHERKKIFRYLAVIGIIQGSTLHIQSPKNMSMIFPANAPNINMSHVYLQPPKTKQINKKEKGTTVQKIIYRIKKKKNSKNRLSFDFF